MSVGTQGTFDEMGFPEAPTSNPLPIIHAEWHSSPLSSRCEDYYVEVYDSYWLLWVSYDDGSYNLHGFAPKNDFHEFEAALALMIGFWLFDKNEFGSETPPDIAESQFFSGSAIQYILDSVWN